MNTLLGSGLPLSQTYDIAMLDLDGTCFAGTNPIEYAADGVQQARTNGMLTSFVTNNASRPPQAVADKLAGLGMPTDPAEVFTSSMDAAAILTEMLPAGSLVLLVGGAGLQVPLEEAGFRITDTAADHPAAVVQGWAAHIDWALLSEAAYAIADGAVHVATNLDSTLPTERGFALGNGSLVAAVAHATEKEPIAAGKPLPGIFQRALARTTGKNPLAVGDRLNTDLAGAVASDIPGLHVLTGVSDARDVILSDPAYRPSYLHTDLRGLNEAHPAPSLDGQWWRVAEAAARVHEQHLELENGPRLDAPVDEPVTVTLNQYRALVAAAWAFLDETDNPENAGDELLRVPTIKVETPQ